MVHDNRIAWQNAVHPLLRWVDKIDLSVELLRYNFQSPKYIVLYRHVQHRNYRVNAASSRHFSCLKWPSPSGRRFAFH